MNTNEKGAVAETCVIYGLTTRGFMMLRPLIDYSPVDLVATKDYSVLLRISVKFRKMFDNGTLCLDTDQVVNGKRVPCNKEIIDVWAVYVPDLETVLYFDRQDLVDSKGLWRFKPAKSNNPQSKPLVDFNQFTIERVIGRLPERPIGALC